MKKISLAALLLFVSSQASAGLISVAGPDSSAGTAPSIIAAPSDALDSTVANSGIQGFNEAQGVTTVNPYTTDQGVIAAGTLVDSHMLFLNKANGVSGALSHASTVWTFSGAILGIMSDANGAFESASTSELGAAGTNYPSGFTARGLESNNGTGTGAGDGYSYSGNVLTLSMQVTQPGDWIRVVTASAVPEPSFLLLLLLGLGLISLSSKNKLVA